MAIVIFAHFEFGNFQLFFSSIARSEADRARVGGGGLERPSIGAEEFDVEDFEISLWCIEDGFVAGTFSDERARDGARYRNSAVFAVGFVFANDGVGDFFVGIDVEQLDGGAEDDAIAR